MNKIWIGYDPRENDAYLVARNSIERRSSIPVLIHPLTLDIVSHIIPPPIRYGNQMWDIESEAPQSTEFSRSRFCVPHIQKQGWTLFIDCDFLCLADIKELFDLADDKYAVMVVKHDYTPSKEIKMDGQQNDHYPMKNASSCILWNTSHPAHYRLTRDRLNRWPGRDLHAFKWLQDDEIGELPAEWNVLVDEEDVPDPKMLHFTNGVPSMPGYENCSYSQLWKKELARLSGKPSRPTKAQLLRSAAGGTAFCSSLSLEK